MQTCSPISQKSAKIVKEKLHEISWVYLQIEKLRENPPPPISLGFFRAGAATASLTGTTGYNYFSKCTAKFFRLGTHTLTLKIVHQTPEIQACRVKICGAPETRSFQKGPSHDLHHRLLSKHL